MGKNLIEVMYVTDKLYVRDNQNLTQICIYLYIIFNVT